MSKRIRVLFIISGFAVEGPQGGVERFVIELSSKMDKQNFDITVCGLWRHGFEYENSWMEHLKSQGISVLAVTEWTGSTIKDAGHSIKKLSQYAATQKRFDIINSHAAFPDIAGIWLYLSGFSNKLVRTLHSEREWYRRPLPGFLFNHLVTPLLFHVELGVSQKIVADLNRRPLAKLLRRRAQVYYNAINYQRLANVQVDAVAKKRSLGLPLDAPIIGNVARFTKQKGHIYFLAMAKQVLQKHPACQFLLIGLGELLPAMKEEAKNLDISENIHFLGPRTDVEELLPVMDIFVSASLWEGLPTVILEAMAAGKPVIATKVSGSTELVQNDHTGLLVSPADAKSLGEAVCTLLNDPNLSARLAKNAGQFVQNFDIEAVKSKYETLFMKLARLS